MTENKKNDMNENTLVCKEIPLRAESGKMPVKKKVLLFTIVLLMVFSLLSGRTVSAETTARTKPL